MSLHRCSMTMRSRLRRRSSACRTAACAGSATGWSHSARFVSSRTGPPSGSMVFDMRRKRKETEYFDIELEDLPAALRWRQWMGRAEAVIFASPRPVTREILARVVGKSCNIEALIDDIRTELRDRPYELVAVAGGWQHRTKTGFADAIRAATGVDERAIELSKLEGLVLTAIAYFQPITRTELCQVFGREISRDLIADLRSFGLTASGP